MKLQVSLTAFLLSIALHSTAGVGLGPDTEIRKGVFYTLTPDMAQKLGLNITAIKNKLQAQKYDDILVKVDELDQLDLSVHSQPAMKKLVADNIDQPNDYN